MAVLVTCKFEDDSIKSEGAIFRTTFSPLKVFEKIFHLSRAIKSEVNSPIWPELIRDFMTVFITFKFDENPIKNPPL